MANNNKTMKAKTTTPSPKKKKRDMGVWLLRNAVLLFVAYMFFTKVPPMNPVYTWLKDMYLKNNMEIIKNNPDLTNEQRLQAKLGADYSFLLYIRNNTPEDAVIYYPSSGDFRAQSPNGQQMGFNGKLNDKLTAVRVLYPRKVVTEDEYGKTSWTKKITHVAVVNGKNVDKVPYANLVDSTFACGILPMKRPDVQQQPANSEQQQSEPQTTPQP